MAESSTNGFGSLDVDTTPKHSTDEEFNSNNNSEITTMEDPNEEEIADLETSIISHSRTIDDFTRIISEWRTERERNQSGPSQQQNLRVRESMASLSASAARDADTLSQYSYEASSVGDPEEMNGISPSQSHPGLNDSHSVRVRCTCCCGRGTRKCKRARRATREWSQMESDLRLAASLGQALLRRSDSLQVEIEKHQEEHGTRIDSMMKKLTSSIKEATQLEKRLEQSELNLEACEASNRALVRELEESRKDLTRIRGSNARNSGLESQLERAEMEVQDLRQELAEERKQGEQNKVRLKKAEIANEHLTDDLKLAKLQGSRTEMNEEERAKRKEEVRKLVESRFSSLHTGEQHQSGGGEEEMASLVTENDILSQENKQMKTLLENRNEEIAQLREELSQKYDFIESSSSANTSAPLRLSDLHSSTALSGEIVKTATDTTYSDLPQRPATRIESSSYTDEPQTPSLLSPQMANIPLPSADSVSESASSRTAVALQPNSSSATKRENRTAQLNVLLDMIQRLFTRLSTADVDTLTKRLQRQKLAGDVGHLARTTVNGILRDVDGLRDHFRRAMDNEVKGREQDNLSLHSRTSGKSNEKAVAESESLVAKKEFYALIKVFKDLFMEMARLRNAVNEVTMQPQHASRILQEQLGVQMGEEKGVTAWFGRLLSTTGLPGTNVAPNVGQNTSNTSTTSGGLSAGQRLAPNSSQKQQAATRSSAAALPSAVAVEVKGMHATEQQSGSAGTSPQPEQGEFEGSMPNHARLDRTRRQPSLNRVQSRNLSGLFVGSMASDIAGVRNRTPSEQMMHGNRLSRIVDDDEILNTSRARTLRPRNLSDSSMHTTYLDDEPVDRKPKVSGLMASATPTPAAISRIVTPSTLSLRPTSNPTDSTATLSTSPNTSSGGLLGNTRSVAKAFGSWLSSDGGGGITAEPVSAPATSSASRPPQLRARSSNAQLALAAATASRTKTNE